MSKICCIINCPSNTANSGSEKRALFKIPNDPDRQRAWLNAIPLYKSTFTGNEYICERHFTKSDLIRKYNLVKDGTTYKIAPRDLGLKLTTVPSIFNNYTESTVENSNENSIELDNASLPSSGCVKKHLRTYPAAKQATMMKSAHKSEKAESMAVDHRQLISAANKVFGEGRWSHTIVSQTLDFVDVIGAKCCAGCVSFVKVQLENGNFHEDVGYCSAEESTKGLSIHNARIGSALNALKRVLLSFGNEIERELQQQQKQINLEEANNVQRSAVQLSDKQIPEKSNVMVKVSSSCIPTVSILQTKHENEPEPNKNSDLKIDPVSISTVKNTEANPLSFTKIENEAEPSLNNETNSTHEQMPKQALSAREMLRMERKRKQMEKQLEFKKRMMEKGYSTDDNKPNPRY